MELRVYRYQRIVAMHEKGSSLEQIAEIMGIKPNSVRIVLLRYGTPERHEAYKAFVLSPAEREKVAARRLAKRLARGEDPRRRPQESIDEIIRRRGAGQPYRHIARELQVSVGVISGVMHRYRKQCNRMA